MNTSPRSFISWRFYFVISFIIVIVLGLLWRIIDLTIFDQHFLQQEGDERVLRLMNIPAFRGMIVDRNGFPLAVSTTVYSAWINPKDFSPSQSALQQLSHLLEIKAADILSLSKRYQKKQRVFAYLKRGLSPEIADQIKSLAIQGVYLQKEYRRYYPEGEVTAQVVGVTNIDDQGQEGLELAYNTWLSGHPGKKWVIKDRLGRIISDVRTVKEQQSGRDLVLSIDKRIQYLAYRELMNGVIQNKALSGSAIVLDAKTGEVLAMVNQPSFNPNARPIRLNDGVRNRAVTDVFEPGSTIKAFSIASALDSGHYQPGTIIDTSPGWMRVGRNVVKDEKNNGPLTLTQILQISSNMGITKMILSLPRNQLWSLLSRVGFGEITGIGFPGEQNGVLIKQDPWDPFALATLSWGYGISVTPLQLARAYVVFANDGVKLPVSLLKLDQPPQGERVIDPSVAEQTLFMLESVLAKGGTAQKARVPLYRVAGKTGTAKIVGEHGYESHYYSSFVGVAPLSDPQFVIAVVIKDPQGKYYYGGDVSGPVFEKIMEGVLRIYNVPPDDVSVSISS